MKKVFVLIAVLLAALCGCSSNKSSNSSEQENNYNDGTTTVDLSLDNIDTYFKITKTEGLVPNLQNHTFEIKGVLTFAVYHDVKLTLGIHLECQYSSETPKKVNRERVLALNAAGEGESVLSYKNGMIDDVVDTGIGNGRLYAYSCTWTIKSISGTVQYRL